MRTTTVNLALAALLFGGVAMGQTGPSPTDPKKPAEEKKPSQLEELLAQALRDNPDVRVAEAKMREAEAELNRARLLAIQKVIAHQHNVETLGTAVKIAEARYTFAEASLRYAQAQLARAEDLFKRGGIAQEDRDAARAKVQQAQADLEAAKATLQAAKADLAKAQAELPYLLGKGNKEEKNSEAQVRSALRWLAQSQDEAVRETAVAALAGIAKDQPRGTVADKLRKALDTNISLKAEDQSVGELLVYLQRLADVPMVPNTVPRDLLAKKLILKVDNISLGAAFQLMEDVGGVQFAVRDYGILVSDKLPSDVTRLHDFWKSPSEKPKPAPEKPKSSQRNLPPGDVEGKVIAIDAASGLVEISVGSDAGLAQGHTLEVYRINDSKGGKYLGTLLIEKTQATRSVGKFINKLNAPVEVGDRVSNKVFVD